MESLDLLANNVANASTGGYKADREFYSLYLAPEAADSDPAATMPVIQKQWTDMSQGLLHSTGSPLDVAINGKGFFAVQSARGTLYTRNGNFQLAPDGKLVTTEGYPVLGTAGGSLTLDATRPIQISSDGTVTQDGAVIGQLQVADFTSDGALGKQGSNYFRVSDPALQPTPAAGSAVQQGSLEESNSGASESAVRLVGILRQFEMLQKAMTLGSDMSKQAIEQVAKVG